MARQAQPLPPLVRRDGLELSRSETSFPAMGYDEDVYEPWPIDAVQRAVELYPDLKKAGTSHAPAGHAARGLVAYLRAT